MSDWPGPNAPISEHLEAARDGRPMPDDAPLAAKLRRRFFEGEWLDAHLVQTEYDTSISYLAALVSAMKKLGFEFERKPIEHEDGAAQTSTYRMLNPDHEPDWEVVKTDYQRKNDKSVERVKRRTAPAPKPKAASTSVQGLPALGDSVEISLLALGEDGDVRIGIRQNGRSWLLKLEGATGG